MTTTNKTAPHTDESIGQRIEQACDRLIEIKQEVTKSLGTRIESLGSLIEAHPFAAVGIGFGIGYLAARILHR
jgi:ElaB/YqjD/DUF883 family membrane-anchored ribosome-binding protein